MIRIWGRLNSVNVQKVVFAAREAGVAFERIEAGGLTLRGAVPREATARQPLCADIDGFSLHAAVRVEAHDRKRLEQLCRTITRPALSDERVQLNAAGQVELKLKTPWRDGTTHLVMSPLEFMQRLAARATEGCSSGTRAAAAAASHPVPWGAGTQRQAAVMGRAAGTRGARAGQRRRHGQQRRGRGGSGPGPAAPHRLGAAAQAGLVHRPAALPELRRRGTEDHRGHPGAAGDREDPDSPGDRSTAAASGTGARGGARLSCLSRAGRRKHNVPGCNTMRSRGSSARHGSARSHDAGSTPRSRQRPALVKRHGPAEPDPGEGIGTQP